MLQVMLAGLVLSKTITLKQAEAIYNELSNEVVTDNVKDVLNKINNILEK